MGRCSGGAPGWGLCVPNKWAHSLGGIRATTDSWRCIPQQLERHHHLWTTCWALLKLRNSLSRPSIHTPTPNRANATITLDHTLGGYPGALDLACVQFPDPHFKARHK